MADQKDLRGGTEGIGAAHLIENAPNEEGTREAGAPSGGVHVEQPSRYQSRTGFAGRAPADDALLAGGKTVAQLRAYVRGCDFPANKEDVKRLAQSVHLYQREVARIVGSGDPEV